VCVCVFVFGEGLVLASGKSCTSFANTNVSVL
jgi:hypothetical protein